MQASSSGATAPARRSSIARKQPALIPARRPKTDELGDFRVNDLAWGPDGLIRRPAADVRAEFAAKNSMCTCSSGVPSFLCRAASSVFFAFEIGMCDPEIPHWDWWRRGKSARGCDCIPWEKIRDDPYDVNCKRLYEEEGDVQRDLDSISTARRIKEWSCLWARKNVRRLPRCPGCGTYLRTCNAFDHWVGELGEGVPKRMGRPVLIMGDDVALACIVSCKGHCHCRMEDWPDVVVDRRGSNIPISKNRNMGV